LSFGNARNGVRRWAAIAAPVATVAGLLAGVQLAVAPRAAAATSHATTIASGFAHGCAIRGGKAYCWGDNSGGALGNGSAASRRVPTPVSTAGVLSGKTLTQITTGSGFSCALDSAGAAYCWGSDAYGQLGSNLALTLAVPVAVSTSGVLSGKTLTQISAGENHVCALDSAGAAYCWGSNAYGQLGNNSTASRSSAPVAVTTSGVLSGKTLSQISAGGGTSCALDSTGAAYCWGRGGSGQLGNNATGSSRVPVVVTTSGTPMAGVTLSQISVGYTHACAQGGAAGTVYCWGHGSQGDLGNGASANSSVPVAVTTSGVLSGKTLTQITAGYESTCTLDSTGLAYCWGYNFYGQLGNNTTTTSNVPVAVTASGVLSGKTLSQISAGGNPLAASSGNGGFTCALDSAGAAYCWGWNAYGQLGNPSIAANSSVPEAVTAPRATTISSGNSHSCMVRGGLAYCWGSNTNGELGNNSTTQSNIPVAVTTTGTPMAGKTITQISAGGDSISGNGTGDSTCALDSTGAAYCWGWNGWAQLGNGNQGTDSHVPVAVIVHNGSGATITPVFTQISVGAANACAIDTTGTAYCWGLNMSGQLGNGNTAAPPGNVANPVSTSGVLSGKVLVQVSMGYHYACAVDTAGLAYCWGDNTYGGLGNGNSTQQTLPVAVTTASTPLAGKTLVSIASGTYTTCALDTAGATYCWGSNNNGQLGNGTAADTSVHATAVAVTATGALSGKSVAQITVGLYTACATSTDGAAYCWGDGALGQLGNGGTADSTTPAAVTMSGPLSGAVLNQVSIEGQSVCAQDAPGATSCWGLATSGQLGNNSTTSPQTTAVAVTSPAAPGSVAAFQASTTAIVYWTASAGATKYVATAFPGGGSCSTTGATTCTITGLTNGISYLVTVVANNGTMDSPLSALATVTPWGPATTIAAGGSHGCTISGGRAYCWGDNTYGQLGNGTTTASTTPVPVSVSGVLSGKTLAQISAGAQHTCALDSTGLAYCWGDNTQGELGTGTAGSPSTVPVAVSVSGVLAGKTLTQISADGGTATPFTNHTCTLDSAGAAYCWGDNSRGEIGNGGTTTPQSSPVAVTGGALAGKVLTQVTTGAASSCALDTVGLAYCWGDDTYGQVGNNTTTTTPVTSPVAVYTGGVLAGLTLEQISGGYRHTCALASNGAAYCWGYAADGELGNGGTTTTGAAVAVTATAVLYGKVLVQISAGGFHTCVLDVDGVAYCWGLNTNGQLGNNTTTSPQTTPSAVYTGGILSGVTLLQISGGGASTCAQDSAGTDYCWGQNAKGQVGNNSTTDRSAAVPVSPQAPTITSATPGDSSAAIAWSAPVFLNTGTITGYTATATPGTGLSCSANPGPCTITGLTNGILYTVTVTVTATINGTAATATSGPATVTAAGTLTVSAGAAATLPSVMGGHVTSSQLGTVTVTDNRGVASTGWTSTVTSTAFTTSGAAAIPTSSITFWSGPATATSSGGSFTGTFTPGQPAAANAVDLTTSRTAFSMTGGNGVNSASWNPTLSVSVPLSAIGTTYTATLTTSVS